MAKWLDYLLFVFAAVFCLVMGTLGYFVNPALGLPLFFGLVLLACFASVAVGYAGMILEASHGEQVFAGVLTTISITAGYLIRTPDWAGSGLLATVIAICFILGALERTQDTIHKQEKGYE